MKCRRCGKEGCRVSARMDKRGKGFSMGRAIVGSLLLGDNGAALGLTGSRASQVGTVWKCPHCGFSFSA